MCCAIVTPYFYSIVTQDRLVLQYSNPDAFVNRRMDGKKKSVFTAPTRSSSAELGATSGKETRGAQKDGEAEEYESVLDISWPSIA